MSELHTLVGAWSGDDLDECLDLVRETRGSIMSGDGCETCPDPCPSASEEGR